MKYPILTGKYWDWASENKNCVKACEICDPTRLVWASSEHFWRFYGNFIVFAYSRNSADKRKITKMAIESSQMVGWSSHKFCWITNFTSFHAVFVFRSSIPIFSCQNSIFHVQLLDVRVSPQATGEKSLKWPWNLEKWSDFTFKKRKRRKKTSLIEWAIVI